MGYLRLGEIAGEGGDCIVSSKVIHVNMNSNKTWIDLVYDFQGAGAQGQGQIRLVANGNFTSETLLIINNAIITCESQAFCNVQLPSGQSIGQIIINPTP